MTQELEPVKTFTDQQLLDFMNGLDKVWKESSETQILTAYDYKILYWFKHKLMRFMNGEPESRNLTDTDKNIILFLKVHDFSIGEIAFAVNRSKSTIHDYLKQNPTVQDYLNK